MTDPQPAEAVRANDRAHGFGHMVPPALAAELDKLYLWQERLFWAALAVPGPVTVQHGRRNRMATVRRLLLAWGDQLRRH